MLNIICFSKDRPLQLHGCLSSLMTNILYRDEVAIHVLAYIQPDYLTAYQELVPLFPTVHFETQQDFAAGIAKLLDSAEFTMFYCDDVVAVRPIHFSDAQAYMADPEIIGVSLRLGRNVERGFFSTPMRQPEFRQDGQFISWLTNGADQDWCYPWDVLGTIYRTDFVKQMWPAVGQAHNPSEFEAIGAQVWESVTSQRRYAAWDLAQTVTPTINVVQSVFPNGVIGPQPLSSELLLHCWQSGLRLDVDRYIDMKYDTWRIGEFFLKRVT